MTHDAAAWETVDHWGPNGAVPWVLMAAFLYYHRDLTILTDETYDKLTQLIRERWGEVKHPHAHLLASMVRGETSSLYDLRERDYPTITKSAALRLAGS
jgi:hypothetical protein